MGRKRKCKYGRHLACTDETRRVMCLKCGCFYGYLRGDNHPDVGGWGEFTKQRDLYRQVLNSTRWKELRKDRIAQTEGHCEQCKKKSGRLEMHHLTYQRLGDELSGDLVLLCKECHISADKERLKRPWYEPMLRAAVRSFVVNRSGGEMHYLMGLDQHKTTFDDAMEFGYFFMEDNGLMAKVRDRCQFKDVLMEVAGDLI